MSSSPTELSNEIPKLFVLLKDKQNYAKAGIIVFTSLKEADRHLREQTKNRIHAEVAGRHPLPPELFLNGIYPRGKKATYYFSANSAETKRLSRNVFARRLTKEEISGLLMQEEMLSKGKT